MLVSLSCSQNHTSRMDNWNSSTAAVFTTTLELCCRKQRSKLSLTNVTHQPHALHPPVPAHRLHKQQKGESTAPTMRITTNPAHSHKKQCRPLTHVRGQKGRTFRSVSSSVWRERRPTKTVRWGSPEALGSPKGSSETEREGNPCKGEVRRV